MSDTSSHAPSCPGRDQLRAFLQGELPDAVARSIAEHVPTCPSCETSLLELARRAEADTTLTALPSHAAPTAAYTGPAPAAEPRTAELFGRFLLLNRLATGGMGVVYRVLDTKLKRVAALKRLSPATLGRADAHARFARECEAIARLDHPNVVRVYEAGVVRDEPYLVMEYVRGGTLAKGDRPNPMPARDIATAMEAVARAVSYAHVNGVLHRDLKPTNVLVGPNGVPKVADFGLAKVQDPDEPDRLTRTGEFLGTPQYMAPEQVRGDPSKITERTDVYGLGALLYDLLANQAPFSGAPVQEVRERVLGTEPVPPSRLRPDVDPHLEAVCLKCLEKDPARRYASAREVAEELALWLRDGTTRVKPSGPVGKAARWVRRHRALTAAAVVALAAAVATPFVLPLFDPDRASKAAARSLERGERVVLVDDAGRPQVRPRVILGSAAIIAPADTPAAALPDASRPPKPGDPLVIEGTNAPALVELMPRVPTFPYRLTAELTHSSSGAALGALLRERVGVYFAADLIAGPDPTLRGYHLVSYTEFRPTVPKDKRQPKDVPVQGPGEAYFKFDLGTDAGGPTESKTIQVHEFAPELNKVRTIAVEVRSDRIDWSWDGAPVGGINSVDIRNRIDTIQLPGIDGRTIVPNLRGGCGLFVQSATLQVRRVTVEPIP
jgi:hypothetical protein